MSTHRTNIPNSLNEHWVPFSANRDFKKNPRFYLEICIFFSEHFFFSKFPKSQNQKSYVFIVQKRMLLNWIENSTEFTKKLGRFVIPRKIEIFDFQWKYNILDNFEIFEIFHFRANFQIDPTFSWIIFDKHVEHAII